MERTSEFDDYWFQSKAEVTSYNLKQIRYGQVREGNATLIFVTEPFNTTKNVKSDNGIGNNIQSVIKLNHLRKFNTGIYPYSIMSSSFTPVSQTGYGQTFKTTNSVQEWCGQVFMQSVKKGNQYDVQANSYFEREGDRRFQLKTTLLEDEIMSLIRINPDIIQEGKTTIIPSAHYLRLMHKEMKVYDATISKKISEEENLMYFRIETPELKRVLTITCSSAFPYTIEGWTEEYPSLNGKMMTTEATKINRLMIDYWNKNDVGSEVLYDQLFPKK
jgi:hypothetical protein